MVGMVGFEICARSRAEASRSAKQVKLKQFPTVLAYRSKSYNQKILHSSTFSRATKDGGDGRI